MSQQNAYFPFSFNEPYPGPDSSQPMSTSAPFTQWPPQDPRAMGHPAPSPSPSVQTVRSAPNPRPANVIGFHQPAPLHRDGRIDPSLSSLDLLQVPQGPRPRSSLDNSNPIVRFYGENGPWSAERPRNQSISFGHSPFPQANTDYAPYSGRPRSEMEDIPSKSDSGYGTMHHPSFPGNASDHVEHEILFEADSRMGKINVGSTVSEPPNLFRAAGSVTDQASQYSRSSARSAGGKEIQCKDCKEVSKCKSDHKKHMLRHNKPFKCTFQNCRRGGKGFTTVNDLNRHKKSVHRINALENSYQCASENCRNREKIWPRLDNFKQHIHRMHKEENEQDLITRSAYQAPELTPPAESLSVAPMDTTLAGIGTERQLPNPSNELDDPVPGMSLTPDQEFNQWNSSDPSTHDFAMDVDQTNTGIFGHDSRNTNMASMHKVGSQTQLTVLNAGGTFERLDTLADVASSQTPPEKPIERVPPRPDVSMAPHTKADQQRMALQKFSKILVRDIQNASSTDAAELVTRVLFNTLSKREMNPTSRFHDQAQSHGDQQASNSGLDILTRKEALKATQAMSNLIKKAPKRAHSFSANMTKCAHCPVTVARPCDMRKHLKRHTKPYGCTYPKCHKRFGAKSDWKRHENSQHFQLESFRCQLPSSCSQTPCGELFYRAETFKSHLSEEHKMTQSDQFEHEVKMRRIGKNGQGQFWCGFCQKIVRLEKKRNAAWDERFDHIDNHFSKEGLQIGSWLCVEARKTKAEVERETDKWIFDEEDMSPSSLDDEVVYVHEDQQYRLQHQDEQEQEQEDMGGLSPAESTETLTSASTPSGSTPKRRILDTDSEQKDEPVQKRNKHEIWRYCCECEGGPYATHTYLNCINCHHQWCRNCNTTIVSID